MHRSRRKERNPGIDAMIPCASRNAPSKSACRPRTTSSTACSRIMGTAWRAATTTRQSGGAARELWIGFLSPERGRGQVVPGSHRRRTSDRNDLLAERRESESRHLEAGDPQGNADDGHA